MPRSQGIPYEIHPSPKKMEIFPHAFPHTCIKKQRIFKYFYLIKSNKVALNGSTHQRGGIAAS